MVVSGYRLPEKTHRGANISTVVHAVKNSWVLTVIYYLSVTRFLRTWMVRFIHFGKKEVLIGVLSQQKSSGVNFSRVHVAVK